MEVFIVPFIIGLIAFIALAVSADSRRYAAQWAAAAQRLQLGYQAGRLLSRPKLSGEIGGLTVRIDVTSSSSGSTNSVRTRYRVGYPPLGLDLRMSRQTGFARAAAMFGMSDTELGDTEFDEAFSIRTSDPQRLSARLPATARRVLLDLVSEYRSLKISDEQLSYEKNGVERDGAVLTETALRLIDGARVLQGASIEPTRRAPAPPPQVREAIPPPPPPLLRPDPFDTRAVFDPTPARPVVMPGPEPDEPASASTPSDVSPITAEDIATDLFAKRGLSFQIARRFEEQYQGKVVAWPGEVRAIRGGIGPADPTQVTVLVATVRNELFGQVQVEASATISGRPPRTLAPGNQVTVQGTLTGIDAMARRLVLDEARIREAR